MRSRETKQVTAPTLSVPRGRLAMIVALTLALGTSVAEGRSSQDRTRGRTTPAPAVQTSPASQDALRTIRAATSVRTLAPFVADSRVEIRRAVISRLGELGGPEALKALADVFQNEPRVTRFDVGAGLRVDVVRTLSRLGTPEARGTLLGILKGWLREGSKVQGSYAHIYDHQYLTVGIEAIKALEPYDDQETRALMRSLIDDVSLFYALREAAWRTSLRQEMKQKRLTGSSERAAFLVTQIELEGALVEARWTGKAPGQKSVAAAREAVIEDMVHELGWPAVEPLKSVLTKEPAVEPRRTLAAARMLTDLVLTDLRAIKNSKIEPRHRDAILAAVGGLSALPQAALTPETGSRVFGQLAVAGEAFNDEGVWNALRDLAPKITFPNAWSGDPPSPQELGVALPSGLVFVPEYSRRVGSPLGKLVEAWYLAPVAAGELIAPLEKATGKTAVKTERGSGVGKETLWTIELQPPPAELAGIITLGVTVHERTAGYRQRILGRTVREGRTLVCVKRMPPR